ncbi:MAG TPA: Gfo/Idh/MocA family oxidoreductase [Caulobacteraceae bacterium]|nr:Gfo/Idh/MocA family oxidoreductase [Caulobacteraceae bacterium]
MKTWRIGVVGLGQRIAAVLLAMREVGWALEVGGHVDATPVGAEALAQAGVGIGPRRRNLAALLAGGPFDLLMIGSPNHLHFDHLREALEAKTPIFAEKPIVRTAAESFALARLLAERPHPPVYVGLVMRSMAIVKEVLARVEGGALGAIISMDATEHLPPEHGAYLARNWRRRRDWGGSYLLDKVCHDFDIFARIAGRRASAVASFGGRRIFDGARRGGAIERTYADGEAAFALRDAGWAAANDAFFSDMDVTDHQTALARYGEDMALAFHANSCTALQERRWYIAGTEATLIADLARNRMLFRRVLDRGRPERLEFGGRTADGHNGADQAMALDLLAAMEGRAPFPVAPADALAAGLTVMAIDEAMEAGAVVDLEPTWARLDSALTPGAKAAGVAAAG